MWSADASLTLPETNEEVKGRKAIYELYKNKFDSDKDTKITIIQKKLELQDSNEAVGRGFIKILHRGEKEQQVAFKAYFVKEDGSWLLDGLEEIDLEAAPSNYDHLKELSWLVGQWHDADDDADIEFNTDWDKNKNFLTQRFKVNILDQEEIEGQMVIGWDSSTKNVRSWVFDSDGAFGNGVWSKTNEGWSVAMKYTLNDGSQASATHLYTNIKDNSYLFTSIDREIDDTILPNVDPVEIIKIKGR